jgi:putative spermidine/putrescine transport system ATP-binding protein
MVFQQYSLFPHMTVAENISFPLRMRRVPKTETATQVERMLNMVRLSSMGDRRPTQLSGGQQQRVALARAAIYDPGLLLMDEPLGALDKNLREEMQDEIKQFQHSLGTTVIYVTHDQGEAASMSHRIAIMNHGLVEQIGTPRELYEHPINRFVASFLGEANLFEIAEMTAGPTGGLSVRTRDGFALSSSHQASPSERYVACVRPERIKLSAASPADAENVLQGTISDVTYAAGSVRNRVELPNGVVLTQRLPSDRGKSGFEMGQQVFAWWTAEDTLLVADEGD